jgi:hypothetical protein
MKGIHMKRIPTFFLRASVFAIGAIVLALCIFALPAMWRAVPGEYTDISHVFYIILLAMYLASLPFFFALYQALCLLNYIDKNKAFSKLSVKALKKIAYCGVAIGAVFSACMPLFYTWAQYEDAPGLIVMGMILVGASLTVAVFSAVLQRLFSEAIDMKSENDLTV